MRNLKNVVLASLLTAGMALAHNGFEHVIGTVAALSGETLTVKTSTGNVDVKLDAKTEIKKGESKAQVSDLKLGVRVVIDIPEESKDHVAHAVKISGAAAAH